MKGNHKRNGLSLLELLLVLSLLVVIASLAIINLRNPFSNAMLRKSADSIRSELARARNKAIKTGQTQVFRHLVGGDGYVTTPQVSPEDFLEADERTVLASDFNSVGVGGLGISNELHRLPKNIFFMGADVSIDQRSASQMVSYQQDVPITDFGTTANQSVAASGATQWGMPIFFFPDGTSSTARMVLANIKNIAVTIELRGLTGIARVSELMPVAQIAPMGTTQ